ncbi:MAG: hypothetical protein AAGJ79_15240 [Verrucomicrobiota bacterium]
MNRPLLTTLAATLLLTAAGVATEDTQPPTIDVSSIVPALGEEAAGSTVVVSGTAADTADSGTAGVARVYYRLQGSRRWRRAILTAQDAASTTFIFSFKIKKGENKRFYVRAFDLCDNESDSIGRRVFRPRVQRREPALSTTTTTDGTTATSTSSSNSTASAQGSVSSSESPSAIAPNEDADFSNAEIPTASPVDGADQLVLSPYSPRVQLDVSGFDSGDVAIDPRNGNPFLVP